MISIGIFVGGAGSDPMASPDGVKSDSPSLIQRQISPQRARIIKNPRSWWFLGTSLTLP